jgi:hypothetical protein
MLEGAFRLATEAKKVYTYGYLNDPDELADSLKGNGGWDDSGAGLGGYTRP